ncbi:uncharacterized protein DDB_G0271670-like [Phymastichus coffea]|uniref:uncharacterized protein DDB_G0271670-like n=1 Tax=Phymastichus coffea TaxID=108790 RepID=UPI00273B178F|nr:uncharacterized protein DDB_G0271670-like [Phymastichus coffea]
MTEELHKPARCNYALRKYDIRRIDEIKQVDLIEMHGQSRLNHDYNWFTTIIDKTADKKRKKKAELAKTVQDELADKIKKRLIPAKSSSSASPSSTSSSGSETLSSSSTSASSTSASSTSASTTSASATSSMPLLDMLQHDEAIDLSTKTVKVDSSYRGCNGRSLLITVNELNSTLYPLDTKFESAISIDDDDDKKDEFNKTSESSFDTTAINLDKDSSNGTTKQQK